jgi:Helix-turn-helix of insertion element transposase
MQRQLTVKQENAIDMLVAGANDREVAEAVGVNRVTVSRWRLYNPQFQAELNRQRQAIWSTAVDRLRALLPRAVDALEAELDGGRHRVRAAVSILQLAGLDRSGPKKTALDTYMIGATDANEIVDAEIRARRQYRDPLDSLLDNSPVSDAEREAFRRELEESGAHVD